MRALFALPMRWKILIGFCIVNLVWSSTYLAIRIAVHTIPPFLMAGIRFVTAGCVMILIARLMGYTVPRSWAVWRPAILTGFLLLTIGNGVVSYAEVYVPSNQAALIVSTSALWMAWLGSLGPQGQKLSGRAIAGLVVGFAGTAFLFWPETGVTTSYLGVQLAILVSSISWAVGTIYFRNQPKPTNIFMFAGMQMLSGGILLLSISVVRQEPLNFDASVKSLCAWLYLVVFGSCIAFAAYVWLIDKISSARLAMVAYITPLVATVLGWVVLDEALRGMRLVGMAIVVTGVILVSVPSRGLKSKRLH